MIEVDVRIFFSALMALGLLGLFLLWMYMESRTTFYRREAIRHCYHCTRCGKLYAAHPGSGKVPCPDCGFENIRLSI